MKIRPFQNLVSSFIVYRTYFIVYTVFIFIIFNVTMLFCDFRSGRKNTRRHKMADDEVR